ncbi:MAG: 3-hydroxyacyl-CoA dehydrogenase NAD-binding domain-containing protein [Candidatus Sericytochromatia bacterium]|nr:3-hydroxyacyl-CoA dehydrogenase NAD-binding domain-containing protein [Candidatus Sericytochromatia bacterium]
MNSIPADSIFTGHDRVVSQPSLGVLGAGTMGTGIAQLLLASGLQVTVYDPHGDALSRATRAIEQGLGRLMQKGTLTAEFCSSALKNLTCTSTLSNISKLDGVIEAAPEDFALKVQLLSQVADVLSPEAFLATNTSSLSVSALAAALPDPSRLLGIHFFNPVHAMSLVELVRGDATADDVFERAWDLVEQIGKAPIACRDTPGFIVNRVARGYYGEALRLVGDHGAEPEDVDRALVLGLGFPLGPCALMDLIGMDVNLSVSRQVWQAFFYEARFAPHPLQQRLVDTGRLGRKTGHGFYRYPRAEITTPSEPSLPVRPLRVMFAGQSAALDAWARPLVAAGHHVELFGDHLESIAPGDWDGAFEIGEALPEVRAARRARLASCLPGNAWIASDDLSVTSTEIEVATGRVAWRFCAWPGGQSDVRKGIEVAFAPHCPEMRQEQVRALWQSTGREMLCGPDLPGLIGPRTLVMLINEAAFAVESGVATPEAIDRAMCLGTGYPCGPLEWADRVGPDRVVALLRTLRELFGERYRPAPWLVRRATAGWPLSDSPASSQRWR